MSLISNVTPNYDELSSFESKPYTFDFTNVMLPGDVISNQTANMTDLTTGKQYPKALSGSCTTSGNNVSQTVFGLIANHKYSFVMYATLSTGKILGAALEIFCPR